MLFRKLLPICAVFALCFSSAARGQFGVYGTISAERVTNFTCLDPQGECAAHGVEKPYGANFGAYLDLRSLGPLRFGADVRGSVLNTNKSAVYYTSSTDYIRDYSVLGGLRVSVATPFHFVRPYGEVVAGYARLGEVPRLNDVDSIQNYTEVEGLVGVDVPILPFMDIRAIEFGAGALFGPATHSVQSIGAGIVFHTVR